MLKKYMGVQGTKADTSKRNPSSSMVNIIGGNNLRASRKPNKVKKYNNNIFKNRNNKTKRLALLGRCPNR